MRINSGLGKHVYNPPKKGASKNISGKKRAILVVGMHRSGTSVLTHTLKLLGCALPMTPSGDPEHWESKVIMNLNDEILASAGSTWQDWETFNPGWYASPTIKEFRERAQTALESEFGATRMFVLKDPRICRLLKFWVEAIERFGAIPLIVSPIRNPLEVAASLEKRDGMNPYTAQLLWLRHVLDAEAASRKLNRVYLRYDDLLIDWHRMAGRLSEAFAISWPRQSTATEMEIEAYISPARRNHVWADAKVLGDPSLSSWIRVTFEIFDRWSHGEIQENDTAKLDQIRSAFDEATPAFSRAIINGELAARRGRTLAAKLQARESDLEAKLQAQEARESDLEAKLAARDGEVKDLTATLGQREQTIKVLLNSTSWRITKPLRAGFRGLGWPLRTTRWVVSPAWWLGTGQGSRTAWALLPYYERFVPLRVRNIVPVKVRGAINRWQNAKLAVRLQAHKERAGDLEATLAARDGVPIHKQLTVAVISWDVCHNPLGRACLIAEALSRHFQVVLLGPAFHRFGGQVWEPQEGAKIPVVPLPGEDFPEFGKTMERVAAQLGADAVVACKPRLPSLLLGHLLKNKTNRPLFVDIDDRELAFTGSGTTLNLDQVMAEASEEELRAPHSNIWTRYAENLLDGVDGLFVSNGELQARYGGLVVAHGRDERLFDPARYDRRELRRELGLRADDRVLLFAGTMRAHKGVLEQLQAVIAIPDQRVKMLAVGQPDKTLERQMRQLAGERLILLGNRPFSELPGYLACADAVCLLQDIDSPISKYQLPAKLTDALAFGLPVLATAVPPLKPMIEAGIIMETTLDTLRDDLQRVLLTDEPVAADRQMRREYFLKHLSYAVVGRTMAEAISKACKQPVETHSELHRVLEVGANVPPRKGREAEVDAPERGLDFVLMWKQQDLFLYGRRIDMLVKYLSARPDVRRVLVLEPPISCEELHRWAKQDVTNQQRAMYVEWMRKSWGVYDDAKVRTHNFTYSGASERDPLAIWRWPKADEYIDSLVEFFDRNGVDPSAATFIVYPNNERIPEIVAYFRPGRVIADVVDDQRAWPNVNESVRSKLTKNYQEVLGLSDFVITNCEPVKQSMAEFHRDIRVLPNGIDLEVDENYPVGARFKEIALLPRPLIGYVGNLEAKIDIELLRYVALQRPQWQLVLVGSTHANPKVLELDELPNIYFPGVVPYQEAKLWIRSFDVAIIPHRRMELTRYMNPLKFYLYLGLGVPVVSTPVDNLGALSRHIIIAEGADAFIEAIEKQLNKDKTKTTCEFNEDVSINTWEKRVGTLLTWLEETAREGRSIEPRKIYNSRTTVPSINSAVNKSGAR